MKKVLVCALAALFLMASCLTAFAAETTPSYVTTTSYVTEDDVTSLKVETTVSGAAADTMLTYLAYKGEAATDESVVFIDQKTADGSTPVKFSYTTAKKNLTGVTVKFGTSAEDASYPKTENLSDSTRVINVVVVDGGSDSITLPTETTVGIYATDIAVGNGYTVKEAVIGETDVASLIHLDGNVVKVEDADALENGATITITLEAPYSYDELEVTATNAGRFTGFEGGEPVEKMTVFGIANTDFGMMEEGFDWGGMLISETNNDPKYEDAVPGGNATAYPAKYRGEHGEFAVQLVNKNADDFELTEKTWYARVYVRSSTGEVTYGPVVNDFIIAAE